MQSAGWSLANPDGTRLESGGVVLDGTSGDTSISYLSHFPAEIYNWTIEIRASWLGHGHSQPAIYVGTERHNYGFVADGWGSQYGLYRDGASPIKFGSYKEQANTWVTLRLEKQANILTMYCDGTLVNVYTEPDTNSSQLRGFSTISPWKGDEKYDYVQASSSVSAPPATTDSGFPVFYVAVGGGIAAVAVIGAAAYFLFFAGGTAASAGVLAGGTAGATIVIGGLAGGSAASVAAGGLLVNPEVFGNVMTNLLSGTVNDLMSWLGYNGSGLAVSDVFGSSTLSPADSSDLGSELKNVFEGLSDTVRGSSVNAIEGGKPSSITMNNILPLGMDMNMNFATLDNMLRQLFESNGLTWEQYESFNDILKTDPKKAAQTFTNWCQEANQQSGAGVQSGSGSSAGDASGSGISQQSSGDGSTSGGSSAGSSAAQAASDAGGSDG